MERETRIRRSRRPIALEGDQVSDAPLVTPGESLSQTLRKPKPLPTVWNSVSATDRSFRPGSYWDGLHGAEVLLLDPCQRTKVNQP